MADEIHAPAPSHERISTFNPTHYLNRIRAEYHQGAEFRGRRNPEQREIAELLSIESDELFDGVKALSGVLTHRSVEHIKDEDVKWGTLTFADYREAFRQMYVGIGVLSNRVARDNPQFARNTKELMQLSDEDRFKVLSELFKDYQILNAYRLGAQGFGLKKTVTKWDEHGEPIRKAVDRDKARDDKEMMNIASRRGYRESVDIGTPAIHAAAKVSPEEVAMLRLEFPEVPADEFFRVVWSNRNPAEKLQEM